MDVEHSYDPSMEGRQLPPDTDDTILRHDDVMRDFGVSISLSVMDASDALVTPEEQEARFTFETFVTLFTTIVCVVGNSLILIVAAR
jgi:hypothetical protein